MSSIHTASVGVGSHDERAGEARSLSRPLSSRWDRLAAQLLDAVLAFACAGPGLLMLAGASTVSDAELALVIAQLGILGYAALNLVPLVRHGQTLGKKAVRIRIVRASDGGNPGFVRAVLMRSLLPGAVCGIPVIGFFFAIADLLCIFRSDRRCLHDHLAGTVVVRA